MAEYRHTSDMGEISGFGGGYEDCCQRMLHAAVTWLLHEKPRSDPKFHSYKDIYGVMIEDNDDAKELSRISCDAATENGKHPENGASGAQHQTVISRALFIKANSWEEYCRRLKDLHSDEKAALAAR